MKSTGSIEIDAPPEKIWPYLTEPGKIRQWFYPIQFFQWTSPQRGGVGSTFYYDEKIRNKTYKQHFETTEWVPNRMFGFKMTEGDFLKGYEEKWTIEKTPNGSRFSYNDHIIFPYGAFGKIIGIFAKRTSDKIGEDVLIRLKRIKQKYTTN